MKAVEDAGRKYVEGKIRKEGTEEADDGQKVTLDKDFEVRYNKKKRKTSIYYSQYYSSVMQWAFSTKTNLGDLRVFYNPQDNTWNKLIADDSEEKYSVLLSVKDVPENVSKIKTLIKENHHDSNGREPRITKSVHKDFDGYEHVRRSYRNDSSDAEKRKSNGRTRILYKEELLEPDGSEDSGKGTGNRRIIKYSLKDDLQGLHLTPEDPFTAEVVKGVEADIAQRRAEAESNVGANDSYNLRINVGVAKNDGKNHVYAITNKKEAPTNYGVSRPVGHAIQSTSSIDSITDSSEDVKRKRKNNLEGVASKKKADENQRKVYTKQDASKIVSTVLSRHMSFGETYGNLVGKSRSDVVEMRLMWML